MDHLLGRLHAYTLAVPPLHADPIEVGPFVVYAAREGGPTYPGRPRATAVPSLEEIPVEAVTAALDEQARRGQPPELAWLAEASPTMVSAAHAAGLQITEAPLLTVDAGGFRPASLPSGIRLSELGPNDDADRVQAVVAVAARTPAGAGDASGEEHPQPAGIGALDAATAPGRHPVGAVTWGAWIGPDPIAVGGHSPWDGVSELVALATLPAYRRRGIARALVSTLVADALGRGAQVVWLGAAGPSGDAVAALAAGVGFSRVATLCTARPATR